MQYKKSINALVEKLKINSRVTSNERKEFFNFVNANQGSFIIDTLYDKQKT